MSKNVYTILDIIVTETSKKILIVINLFNLSLNYSVIENLENFENERSELYTFEKVHSYGDILMKRDGQLYCVRQIKNNATASNIH